MFGLKTRVLFDRRDAQSKQSLHRRRLGDSTVTSANPGSANFNCQISQAGSAFEHFWEHTVGSDHAPIALRADWQAQIQRCREELGFRYVRFHGLLSDDMGTLTMHQDRLLYSFFNIDQIFDFLLSIGMRPFVELSFMPTALASGHATVFRYAANVTPPKDYAQWAELVTRLVRHWAQRYSLTEVRQWFFEVWNEPNLEPFWSGTQAQYFSLYEHTARAIKSVDPAFKVGGPATAKNAWIDEFVEFCESNQGPVDFISPHHYPTDALGHEDADTETQLSNSQRSLLREQLLRAKAQAGKRPLYYTEWNSSSNPRDPLHDEPYAAAFVIKTVMEAHGMVQAYSFWTFTDIFAENYFPSVPFHGGFGLLNLHGIAKPMYRAFELLHRLGNELLEVEGGHPTVDTWVVRSTTGLTVLVSNHALPRHPIEPQNLSITLGAAPAPLSMVFEQIDADHANAKALWQAIGAPQYLDAEQLKRLADASALHPQPQSWRYENRTMHIEITVPPQGVVAITVEFEQHSVPPVGSQKKVLR